MSEVLHLVNLDHVVEAKERRAERGHVEAAMHVESAAVKLQSAWRRFHVMLAVKRVEAKYEKLYGPQIAELEAQASQLRRAAIVAKLRAKRRR